MRKWWRRSSPLCGAAKRASREAFRRRGDFSYEITHQLLVGQGGEPHLARPQPSGAGIDGFAIKLDHALLACIGIDAGKTDGEVWIAIDPYPAQAVEHRLARLEWHLIGLPMAAIGIAAAPDRERRLLAHEVTA